MPKKAQKPLKYKLLSQRLIIICYFEKLKNPKNCTLNNKLEIDFTTNILYDIIRTIER